jgi:L-lactate utilization protein LutB
MSYDQLASAETIQKATEGLTSKGYDVFQVANGTEALQKIKELIPAGASVMNGSSVTLETIGYIDYLKAGQHGWSNLHERVLAEKDKAKQSVIRREVTVCDYYLGSVHALTEDGQIIIASNTASQLPSVVFNGQNLIFVVGVQKIVPTLDEGMKRLEEYVVPLEENHMQQLYKMSTQLSKILIFKKESTLSSRKINVILVNEKLGF